MCTKDKFATEAEASSLLGRIWSRPKAGKLPVRIYRCGECHGSWHLTSWPIEAYRAERDARRELAARR